MKTIVVGYDDTEPAKRALQRAAELAGPFGARVVVTSVAPVIVGRGGPVDPSDSPDDHRTELAHARAFLAEHAIEAEYDLALDDPANHIVHLAAEKGADLIVVGTSEPNLLQRVLGMSVTSKVEHRSGCDVLIVH